MSDAGKKGTIAKSIPEWEAELWSYVSYGDGTRCPLRDDCPTVSRGGWCPDDNREQLSYLLDVGQLQMSDYDFVGAEKGNQCRMVQLLEKLAGRYLEAGKIFTPPVSTELVALCDRQRNTEIRQLPLRAYHGAIWQQKDSWIIQVKESDNPPTQRFTIFHEAFHILAHYKTTPVFRKRRTIVGSFNEWLADSFAFCALMPRRLIVEKWAEVKDLDKMAQVFVVPKSTMFLRLRQFGLI